MKSIKIKLNMGFVAKCIAIIIFASTFMVSCSSESAEDAENKNDTIITGQYNAKLTFAPEVPASPTYKTRMKVVVKLEVIERVMRLADGVDYTYWTFGGQVPGKFIRIREGDEVEFHLMNHPSSKMPHNIDLHAVTGPGGGAAASLTAPGHESQFSFKALNPGLYVYHCATAPVGMHIANGMYGLILVEPKAGLKKVDKEFYIMQSEFYTKGKFGETGIQSFDMDKALREEPDYVVFNGSIGANTGENALKVKVGETVRLYVGNGGPSLISSFHVIGEIFDKVYIEGGERVNWNVQTTLIPVGGSAIVEFKCDAPGILHIVDHSIFRAFNKGAIAQIKVEGENNNEIYSGKQHDIIYQPEGSAIQKIAVDKKAVEIPSRTKSERITLGESLYKSNCSACHLKEGQGITGSFPPIAGSDYLKSRDDKGINIVLKGLSGKIKVNGKQYDGVMPQLELSDDEIANVLTFIHNSWGNSGATVDADEVYKKRIGK